MSKADAVGVCDSGSDRASEPDQRVAPHGPTVRPKHTGTDADDYGALQQAPLHEEEAEDWGRAGLLSVPGTPGDGLRSAGSSPRPQEVLLLGARSADVAALQHDALALQEAPARRPSHHQQERGERNDHRSDLHGVEGAPLRPRSALRVRAKQGSQDSSSALASLFDSSGLQGDRASRHRRDHDVAGLGFDREVRIPGIVCRPDFDPRDPDHMRAFEVELGNMASDHVARQNAIGNERPRLTQTELDLAARGMNIGRIRQARALQAFEQQERAARNELPPWPSKETGSQAGSRRSRQVAKGMAKRQFASRQEEGQYLQRLLYHEEVDKLKRRLRHAGHSMTAAHEGVSRGLEAELYMSQHVKREQGAHVKRYEKAAKGARLFAHEKQRSAQASKATAAFVKEQEKANAEALG